MVFVTRKVVRQKLMQAATWPRSIVRPADRHRPGPRELQVIRANVSRGPLMLSYLQWWEQIVESNDIDAFRAVVARDDETGNDMRSLSPLSVLLTEE
ncbi:hypothetical protein GS810_25105 [Rhodococcus hoagii]|nr:hypothetical protein [Prescottella equi]